MEPRLNRLIKYGSRGDDVVQVQQSLNRAVSSKPELIPDGIFGAKSAARAEQFQRSNQLTADGIVGPKTWAKLLAFLQNLVDTPPTDKDKHKGIRQRVLNEAGKLVGTVDFSKLIGGRPKGIDVVKTIFKEAANVTLQDDNFKDPFTKVWSPQPFISGQRKSWCGIFCVYCYRKAGISTVRWNLNIGAPVGNIGLNSWSTEFVQAIKLADIGAVATRQHHFLIEKVDPGNPFTPRLNTIDGNLLAGRIQRRSGYHQVGKDNFNYYSLK
ncbi:MAG: peptidoglycan-binding protein [Candidatus Thiodiazotropha sp. (ex Ctena orbiculata)]|nr:peptidoglycan-binding protein [Candidatus Thiodiazotropha taylori]